jgi:hypothetical protein
MPRLIDKPSRSIYITAHFSTPRGGYAIAHYPAIAASHIASAHTLGRKRMILQAKRLKISVAGCTEDDNRSISLKQSSLREQHAERRGAMIHHDCHITAISLALNAQSTAPWRNMFGEETVAII